MSVRGDGEGEGEALNPDGSATPTRAAPVRRQDRFAGLPPELKVLDLGGPGSY